MPLAGYSLIWCQLAVLNSLPVLSQSRGASPLRNHAAKDISHVQWLVLSAQPWWSGLRHNHSMSAGVWGGRGNPWGNSWHHLFPSRFPFSVPNPVQSPSPTTWITRSHVLFLSQLFCEKYFWKRDRIPWSHDLQLLSALRHTQYSGQFIYLQLGCYNSGVCLQWQVIKLDFSTSRRFCEGGLLQTAK